MYGASLSLLVIFIGFSFLPQATTMFLDSVSIKLTALHCNDGREV